MSEPACDICHNTIDQGHAKCCPKKPENYWPARCNDLKAENELLRAQLNVAVKALESVTKSNIMPPDPNAHGWEAFGRSAMALATDKKFKAINALATINEIGK